jgi:DNA-binding NarL/FixJ family response regulator
VTAVSVVLADDEPLVLDGVRRVLEPDADIVLLGTAADGVAALAEVRRHRPDVALLDIRMPRMDGIEVARRVTGSPDLAHVRVVLLTTFGDDELLVAATRAGATGYLLKSMPPEQIRAAVHAAARGEMPLAPSLVQRLLDEFAETAVRRDPRLDRLTGRESDVLRQVALGRSNAEIARDLLVSEGTVKTHVAALLRKLEVRDRTQAAVAAYELGLVRPGRP